MKYIFSVLITLMFFSCLHAQNVNLAWAKKIGGDYGDAGNSIVVDASGNVYTTGLFRNIVDFDPGPGTYNLTSAADSYDIFISKLDASGNFVWAKRMGGVDEDYGLFIAVDASGNVYTTGYFQGTADFDPGVGTYNLTSAGYRDIFVSKLDASGNFVWAKNMGGADDDRGASIAVDASGNVYTTGFFTGTVDFDPGPGTYNLTSTGYQDIFVSKLNASGNFVWAKRMGSTVTLYNFGNSMALDASGNVYTTGSFSGTTDFDPGPGTYNLTSAGYQNIFVSKLDSLGNFVWAKSMSGASSASGLSITVNAFGNVYTTGYFYGTADFDPGTGTYNLTSAGQTDIFVSKLDASGNFVWAKNMGGASADYGKSIAVDASGNVYTIGYFYGTADFDPGAGTYNLTSAGQNDIFVSKLDASGNFIWAKKMGGADYDYGNSISVDASFNVYTTGSFWGTVDFDPGPGIYNLIAAGLSDVFVVKLSQAAALPMNLISFTAQKQQNDVMTNWETASQLNFSHYEIERSLDATHFEKAGTVQPINGSGVLNYQFKDLNAVNIYKNNWRLFYRLKMVDLDRTTTYSKIVRVDFDKKYTVQVYPNPASKMIHIESDKKLSLIKITDLNGRTIKQFSAVFNNQYDVSSLSKGAYIIFLTGDGETTSVKLIVR